MGQSSFGPFVFDGDSHSLKRDGKPVLLGGRGAATLETLIEANGEVVGKPEDYRESYALLSRAIAIEPHNGPLLVQAAYVLQLGIAMG
jgi:hypothetical protein